MLRVPQFIRRYAALAAICLITSISGCSQQPDPVARQFGTSGGGSSAEKPKHVLLISIDTCRADHLSSYGFAKKTTPNIDAVAEQGALFRRAQSTNPITLPAHSSMLTGTLPPVHGVRDNYDYRLGDSHQTLAEVFQKNGFQTAAFVASFPLAKKFGLSQGFDHYDDRFVRKQPDGAPEFLERSADAVTKAAIGWLDENHDEPFFMFVHYFDPHGPYEPPEEFADRYSGDPYAAEIAYTDDRIGQLLERFASLGLYDETMIVITSDHGESLDEHGEETHSFFIYQSTAHIPLVIKSPGRLSGVRIEEPVSIIDIAPTILAAVELESPPRVQGIDLQPYLVGKKPEDVERPIYIESLVPTTFGCSPLRSIVRDRWQYIWSVRSELYDLDADPQQTNNLIDAEAQLAGELHIELLEAMADQGDANQDSTQVLDDRDRARLQTLGYVGGSISDAVELHADMRDPKDFIKLYQGIMEAEGLIGQGQFDEAAQLCELLNKSDSDVFRVHELLAKLAEMHERPDEAIAHYTRAVEAAAKSRGDVDDPDTRVHFDVAEAYIQLGGLLFQRGDFAASQETFAHGVELFPTHAGLSTQYGAVLIEIAQKADSADEKQKLIEQAKDALTRVLETEPKNADAHNNLGFAYLIEGKKDLARKHILEAVRWNPNHAAARANLQRVRMLGGSGKSTKSPSK